MIINVEKITKSCRKMLNWKSPGKDGVQRYWIKNLSNLPEQNATQTNKMLMGDDSLLAWMTYDYAVLCQKDLRKGNIIENYCPIVFLSLMWKLLTEVIAEKIYDFIEHEKLLPKEKKESRRGRVGTKDQLLIYKTVLKDQKKRHISLFMVRIDYRKAYDFVLHSPIKDCLELFGIENNVKNVLKKSIEQWKLLLTSNG